ncbi:pantetheine-phosphate adenylyltransferase, partial [Candidatus Bathyarchaeota archaeon]|nr:pantetheine-phosphate adenylyltransferase [Candidatus Bathyarchaeota archaeon]
MLCSEKKATDHFQKTFRVVALGGTFDCFHKGHEAMILKALAIGEKVIIGLTSDEFAKRLGKPHPIKGFEERKIVLEEFLRSLGAHSRVEILPLNDPYGIAATSQEIEALIVSEETEQRGLELNELRKRGG